MNGRIHADVAALVVVGVVVLVLVGLVIVNECRVYLRGQQRRS